VKSLKIGKNKKIIITTACIILLFVVSIFGLNMFSIISDDSEGVGKNLTEKDKLIGEWETQDSINDDNILQSYIFYENDTLLSTYITYNTGETHIGWADYYFEEGKLCMKTHPHGAITDDDFYCYDYSFSEKNTQITLSTDGLTTVTLIKVNYEHYKFIGSWVSDQEETVTFNQDGACNYYGAGEWELGGKTIFITLDFTGGKNYMSYKFSFSEDDKTLILTDPSGGSRIFTKE